MLVQRNCHKWWWSVNSQSLDASNQSQKVAHDWVFRSPVLIGMIAVWFVFIAASAVQDGLNGAGIVQTRIWLLDLDQEVGLYTWFSTINLALASILLGLIGVAKFAQNDRTRFHWILLSIIFMGLSTDEHSSTHEKITGIVSGIIHTSGLFNFAWVIPAIAVCTIGLVFYIPFVRSFPPRLRTYLILSAAAFLTGAIGMEMLGGAVFEQSADAWQSFSYRSLVTIEEALEGGAVILFIAVLVTYGTSMGAIRSPIVPPAR